MAYYDDERDPNEDAAQLKNALTSSDGRVLGVKWPEPIPSIWDLFGPDLMQWVGNEGGRSIGDFVRRTTKSELAAKVAQTGVGYGTTYLQQVAQALELKKTHKENRAAVLQPIAPLLAANKFARKSGMLSSIKSHFNSGHGDNKMVEFALGKVTEDTMQNVKRLGVDTLPSLLTNYGTYLYNLEHPTPRQEKQLDFIKSYGNKLAGAARLGLKRTLKDTDIKEVIPQTSLGKVIDLQEMIRANNLDSPSNVASSGALEAVTGAVQDIFQTYQKEQQHKPIPSHRMREVAKQIAEELIGGDLSSLSLVNLVGKEKLLTDKKDNVVSSEKIAEVLKQETAIFSKSSAITSEDFFKGHENFTLDDVKAHLQSKNIDERALVAFLVPDAVLMEAGGKKEDIVKLNQHFSKKMQEGIFTAVIKGLASQTDDQLEDKGFSREAIVFIRDHEGQGAESIAHAMQSKPGVQQLKELTLDGLMGEEPAKWQDVIVAGRAAGAKLKGAGPASNDEAYTPGAHGGEAANDAHHPKSRAHAARVRASQEQGIVNSK